MHKNAPGALFSRAWLPSTKILHIVVHCDDATAKTLMMSYEDDTILLSISQISLQQINHMLQRQVMTRLWAE